MTCRETTLEPILGWRAWRILPFKLHSGPSSLRLCAVGTLGTPKVWEPGRPTVAVCSSFTGDHEAPWLDHWGENGGCGIWAFKDEQEARRRLPGWMENQGESDCSWAVGRVSLWGVVIEHERGWRAQYAYPYALEVHSKRRKVADDVRSIYAADVQWAGRELIRDVTRQHAAVGRESTAALVNEVVAKIEAAQRMIEAMQKRAADLIPEPPEEPDWEQTWWRARPTSDQMLETLRDVSAGTPTSTAALGLAMASRIGCYPPDRWDRVSLALTLKRLALAGRVVQLRRGSSGAHWLPVEAAVPDGWTVVDPNPRSSYDETVLTWLSETLSHCREPHASVRDILTYFGRPGASRSERALIGSALKRLAIVGKVEPVRNEHSIVGWRLA